MAVAQIEEMEHRIALQLAAPLRKESRAETERSILAWFKGATIIREAMVKAKRTIKNRARSKKAPPGVNYGVEFLTEIALLVVMRVCGKANLEELTPAEVAHITTARADGIRAASDDHAAAEGVEGLNPASVAGWSAVATAAASAYAHATGTRVKGSIAAPAILGSGKHNSPMRVATLALAELGVPNAEIQRVLQTARPGDLKSRAQIRRLARPARVT